MYGLTKKQKLNFILEKVKELDITSYDIGKKTNLSISGIDKILNGTSKNPHENTLNTILEFLENKVLGSEIGKKQEVNEPAEEYSDALTAKFNKNPLVICLNENSKLTREIIILQGLLRKHNIPFKNIFEEEEEEEK